MRLIIGEYEVDIKAKKVEGGCVSSKCNLKDTQSVLNVLSSCCYQAYFKYKEDGYPCMANDSHKMADDIFHALEAQGIYDNI